MDEKTVSIPKTENYILSTAYFAPISYYSKLLADGVGVIIERHENYNKKSYRNRCTIYTANGLCDLVVPVVKVSNHKIPITEVEISYDTPWQKLHFKTIESAYRRSPFYEYYIDDLMIFFNERFIRLYEFNMQILFTICRLIKIPLHFQESSEYIKSVDEGVIDLRNSLHPKINQQHADSVFVSLRYTQVFADKWGFKSNLSILDLLFNTGPEAKKYL